MVIITTMVAKIYFPSWLEPREEPVTRRPHAYLNVMDHAYKSDLSDEEEEETEEEDERKDSASFVESGGMEEDSKNHEMDGLLMDAEGDGCGQRDRKLLDRQSSSLLFDYDQGKHSKQSVYTNLVICAVMLNLTFVIWGLLQVRE